MVLLTTTPRILEAISLLSSTTTSSSLDTSTLPKSSSEPISHTTIITIVQLLRSQNTSQLYTLSNLLHKTRPYVPPPPPPPPKTPEYLALRTHLLASAEASLYNTHLHSSSHIIPTPLNPNDSSSDDDDITPSLVLNIFLSIVLCSFAIWHMTRYWHNDGLRVLVSMGTGVIVGVAEVVVYAAYRRGVGEARRRERGVRERKEVVGSVLGEREDARDGKAGDEEGVVQDEKEEGDVIWGKGKHGGMRRRVREKWEKEQQQQ